MQKVLLVLAALLIAGTLAWEFIPLQFAIWDGAFDLTVNVSSDAGPLRSVACKICIVREEAEFVVAHPMSAEAVPTTMLDPFDGEPFTVNVPMSGRASPLGRELARRQWKYLAVIGRSRDGRQFSKVVEIPDYDTSREVHVSLP